MHRLILCLLTGLIVVFLPQYLLAEDPAGPPGPPQAQPAGPHPEIFFNRLDANHDGFITQDELPPGMPEMFKQLLFLADSNGDGKITKDELADALNRHRPGPGSEPPPFGRRFRGPEGQSGQMPGPPYGPRFGGPESRPGEMAGPPFGRQGMGPGWMGGPRFGGQGGRPDPMAGPPFRGPGEEPPQNVAGAGAPEGSVLVEAYSVNKADPQTTLKVMQTLLAGLPDVRMDIDPKTNNLIVLARPPQHATIRATLEKMQHDVQGGTDANEKPTDMAGPPFGGQGGQGGWMGGQGFGGPGMGPGWMGGQGFGRGGPGDRPPQMAGPNFQGPDAGSHRMGGSPFIGPEGRPWAGPGYGPPHRWAAFGPMQQRPWQQFRHYGQPNRHWQANFQRPNHPGMAYGARPQGPWQQYGHYGPPNRHWQANFQRPNHPGKAYGARPQHPWQQYGHYGPPNSHWQANYERPQRPQFSPKTLFERLDTNNDNQLSFEEFSQGMKHLLKNFLPGPGPQWARPVGLFGGQGFGPPAYHAMANYPASRSEIIGEKIAMIFQTFDKNHDGKLTKDEAPPMIQKNFDRIDVDKKGFVTPRDLYRAITQMRQRAEAQKSVDQGAQTKPEKNETKDKSE